MPDKHTDHKNTDDDAQSKPDAKAEAQSYLQEQKEGVKFLRRKFSDLHSSPEAKTAAKRTEGITGEKVPQKPEARIANYLHRFREILDRKDEGKRQRGIEALKRIMHRQHVIKSKDISESAFLLEQRIARELGHGDVEITDEFRERKTREIINNQTRSLDRWLDYLTGPDVDYPDWAGYWAFSSMLKMGKFQKKEEKSEDGEKSELKETARYLKRRKDTAAAFPMLNSRALAETIAAIKERKSTPKNKSKKLSDDEYQKLIATEDFSKIYTQFLIEMPEYSTEGLQETRGEWMTYGQGSDADPLVKSLEGYPLEWCTAEFETAQGHLEGGDFHVYYSFNEDGEALIPRLAIRMESNSIAEVRGIAPDQNIDPYIAPVLQNKLKDFGSEGEVYQKKASDMKHLTEVEKKHKADEELTEEELRFLYELDSKIQGFGYDDDPRIEEVKSGRNIKEDAKIIDMLTELEKRFTKHSEHYERPKGIDLSKVKSALEASPEALKSLALMEITGGAPDIVAETETEYVFADCSAESPNRRNLNYDQSAQMAERFDIELMDEDTYRKMQETGQFDLSSWSWLKTPADIRESGDALDGDRGGGEVDVGRSRAGNRYPALGWRGLLRVPKA